MDANPSVHPNAIRYDETSFLPMAELVFGTRFDYSRVVYVTSVKKVEIICREHGPFWQSPNGHWRGKVGCKPCANRENAEGRTIRKSVETVIREFKEIHGDRYDYSKVVETYKGVMAHVIIICKTHGEFLCSPNNHRRTKGCPQCGDKRTALALTRPPVEYLAEFVELHGDFYDYSEAEFKGSHVKIKIICPEHGSFWQAPTTHTRSGCNECGTLVTAGKRLLGLDVFISRSEEMWGKGTFDYSNSVYVGSSKKIELRCIAHDVTFIQYVNSHYQGKNGCPQCKICNERGCACDPNKPGILYYLRIFDGIYLCYKIGITTRTVEQRYSKDELQYITVLWEESFQSSLDAWLEEQQIIATFKKYVIAEPLVAIRSGHTEIFTEDVLRGDTPNGSVITPGELHPWAYRLTHGEYTYGDPLDLTASRRVSIPFNLF